VKVAVVSAAEVMAMVETVVAETVEEVRVVEVMVAEATVVVMMVVESMAANMGLEEAGKVREKEGVAGVWGVVGMEIGMLLGKLQADLLCNAHEFELA